MSEVWEGGCLCQAVRFRASGAPKWTIWCHCQSCRKHSGAPVSAFAAFDAASVEVVRGEITRFASSPGVLRGFCATCGSTLTCEGDRSLGELHIHIGAFDEPERLAPIAEVFPEERLPWVCFSLPTS
ncbi:GFA family protein [Phenylobacterium sp.]|uniref:GFA family protein n=1 Tax=Phenylobacterium sp. TaxID=1871053 RepID=UPI0028A1C786|nr:GFA family protein [Phenylobacterium sp.]